MTQSTSTMVLNNKGFYKELFKKRFTKRSDSLVNQQFNRQGYDRSSSGVAAVTQVATVASNGYQARIYGDNKNTADTADTATVVVK